jgi:hypothetical protein
MPRTEVSWNRETPEGEKLQAYAHRIGDKWEFFSREKRFDNWRPISEPALEDWLELLDGVRRRIGRHLARKDDEALVVKEIKRLFPGTAIPKP